MAKTVGELDFPQTGFMESRRGTLVQVWLSNALTGARRTYVRVPEGAGEIPAGVYSTLVKQVEDDDPDYGWMVAVDLEREPADRPVRDDVTLDQEWHSGEQDLLIASTRDTFVPQEPPPEREGDQPVNPYGMWALDEQGRAFRVELDVDEDDAEEIWVEAATRYGKSLHPWHYVAAMTEDFDEQAEAVAAGEAVQELQMFEPVGDDLHPYERWRIGMRRAIEAAATEPLPEFDPGRWMRWLTPVDGGDPVAFGGFFFPEERTITLQPVMPVEPQWAQGRVLTIPRERPGVEYEERREVTVYGKAHAELRSSVAKIRKRPPVPIGRFALEPEGYMPPSWSSLG